MQRWTRSKACNGAGLAILPTKQAPRSKRRPAERAFDMAVCERDMAVCVNACVGPHGVG